MSDLPNRVQQATRCATAGEWHRHVPLRYLQEALDGRASDGRWSRTGGHAVLYLGRPVNSVVVEAYRHLVDPSEGMRPELVAPLALITCDVSIEGLLDLRPPGSRIQVGLTLQQLQSATTDKDAYRACQEVAAVAHQLGFPGLLAPAATELGETLALFPQNLRPEQKPRRRTHVLWDEGLPDDPRGRKGNPGLRVVR